MTSRLVRAALLFALLLLCAPGSAAAAPWTCDASVVRGQLGSAPSVEPVTANRGASSCTTRSAGGTRPGALPLGVTGGLLFATKVRFRVGNLHLFRTFTLPKYVDIG
ncbi:MAG: hypothetical protein ABI611_10180 [Solirubrobacteraceae bacterium]